MIPVMEEYKYHEGEYLKRIMKRLEYDLVAILPGLEKQNDIDKATKVRKLGDYHFPIKSKKLYQWEYKNRMKVPKPPDEEKPSIKKHVEEAVDEELGEVYHLIRSLKRQIQTDELQRQTRARSVNQARREEQRARDVRGETFQNSQFNGRRKRNVSDDIVETTLSTTKSTTSAKTSIVARSTVHTTPAMLTTTTTPTTLTTTTIPTTLATGKTTTIPRTTTRTTATSEIPRTTTRTTATSEMPTTTTFGISTSDSNQQVSNFTMAVKLKQLPTSSTMITPQQTTEFTTNIPSTRISSQTQSNQERKSVSTLSPDVEIPEEFMHEFHHWQSRKWIISASEDLDIDHVNWTKIVRNKLPRTINEECAKNVEMHKQLIKQIINDWETGRVRGRLNAPKIKRLHNMTVGYCYRNVKPALVQIRRQMHNYLDRKLTELARQHSRSKRNVITKVATKVVEKITLENLAGLVVDGIGSFINWQKDKAIKKGIETLQVRQEELKGKIIRVSNDLLSVARTTAETIKDVWVKLIKQNAKISALVKEFNQMKTMYLEHDERLQDHEHSLRILAWGFGTLQTLLQRNLDHYDALESEAEILFNALDSLSMGRLNHHIVSASDLTSYLKHVEEVIQEEYPQYELAI